MDTFQYIYRVFSAATCVNVIKLIVHVKVQEKRLESNSLIAVVFVLAMG